MTVKELIEQLKSVPEDTMIVLDEGQGIYNDGVFVVKNQKYYMDENRHDEYCISIFDPEDDTIEQDESKYTGCFIITPDWNLSKCFENSD